MTIVGRLPIAAIALAAALTAAGCSSSDDSAAPTTLAGGSSTSAGATSSTAAPTTSTIPKADLPPCPVSALASATAPVEITFWHAMNGALEDTLKQLTDSYNASQAKVKVTLVNQTGYDQNLDKYRTAQPADRPEIVQLSETSVQLLVDSKTVIPVQSCIDAESYDMSDYLERVTSFYSVGGALWPMPFNVSNPVLFYNKQAFTKAGLDPEKPPATIDELRADSEKIVASGAAKYGLAFDVSPDGGGAWFIEQWFAKAGKLYADNDNGRTKRAEKVLFAKDPFGAELLGGIQKMVTDGLAINVGANTSGRDNLLKIADQKEPAAMTINTSAAITSVLEVLKAGSFPQVTLGVGPMPGPPGDGGVLVGGAALWLVKDKPDEKTAAAWDYVKFLTSAASQATWSTGTGYLPIRKSAVDSDTVKQAWTAVPELRVPYDQLLSGTSTPATAGPVLGPQRQIREEVAKAVDAISKGGDVASSLQSAADASDKLLADYASRTGG